MTIKEAERYIRSGMCKNCSAYLGGGKCFKKCNVIEAIKALEQEPKSNIKALGEDIRICQKSITDEKVLIGFNMAVAICNKHLAESEVSDADSN